MKTSSDFFSCFRAMGDPNRLEILMLLAQDKRSINEIADNFNISRPAVSKPIKVLPGTLFISIGKKEENAVVLCAPIVSSLYGPGVDILNSSGTLHFKN